MAGSLGGTFLQANMGGSIAPTMGGVGETFLQANMGGSIAPTMGGVGETFLQLLEHGSNALATWEECSSHIRL